MFASIAAAGAERVMLGFVSDGCLRSLVLGLSSRYEINLYHGEPSDSDTAIGSVGAGGADAAASL